MESLIALKFVTFLQGIAMYSRDLGYQKGVAVHIEGPFFGEVVDG